MKMNKLEWQNDQNIGAIDTVNSRIEQMKKQDC